jgi:hypothetical protein
LEIRGRRATPGGRVEKVVKAERVEKGRTPHVQQENIGI